MTPIFRTFATLSVAAAALLGPAQAEAPDPEMLQAGVDTLNGVYTFSAPSDGSKGCSIILKTTGSGAQFDVEPAADCEPQFPFLAVLSGWQPQGTELIRLIGAEGSLLMEFAFTGENLNFDATQPFDGVTYRMQRQGGE